MPIKRYCQGADIPMRVIRRYARQIAKQFHPEKIILFGSRACGTPHEDSDVDLLVVMPAQRVGSGREDQLSHRRAIPAGSDSPNAAQPEVAPGPGRLVPPRNYDLGKDPI